MVTKRPSSPRIGRIWVSDAWFGGVGRGGTTMTTGSGGGGGGGGGLGAQAATLASSPTTMILRDEFIMLSPAAATCGVNPERSEEHTSELQSLMRSSYAVFCLKKKTNNITKLVTNTPSLLLL